MGKKNRTITTTSTNVEDRRIGAEGGSLIVAEGGSFADNRQDTDVFNLIDSDTAGVAVEVLGSTSRNAIDRATGAAESIFANAADANQTAFDSATDIVSRALDLSEAAGNAQQSTASAAIAKTASEGNQALESITRAAMVIAAAFFAAQIFRS